MSCLSVEIPHNIYKECGLIYINPLPQDQLHLKKQDFMNDLKEFEVLVSDSVMDNLTIYRKVFQYILSNLHLACSISDQVTRKIFEKTDDMVEFKFDGNNQEAREIRYACRAISDYIYEHYRSVVCDD